MSQQKNGKVGYFTLRRPDESGNRVNVSFGTLFTSPIKGVYNVALSLAVTDEDGNKVYKKITKIALEGEKKPIDITDCFINLNLQEDLEKRPPFKG
jgi:hypothetical protein